MQPMLERCAERRALQLAVEAAISGRSQIVHISGPVGIGKSRLIAEFLAGLPAGASAAVGNCQTFQAARPLGALFDMSNVFGETFRATIDAAVRRPDMLAPVISAIRELRPTPVLVFEDLHQADQNTLDLLRFLCPRIEGVPAVIVMSYRSDQVSPDHPLTAVLANCPSRFTTRLPLRPLSQEAITQLAKDTGAACDWLYDKSGGNPFLALSLLNERSGQKDFVPLAIIEYAKVRFAAALPEEQAWLRMLAIHPAPVPLTLLEHVGEAIDHTADGLPGWSGFLVEGPDEAICFRYQIVRDALQSTLPPAVRRAGHKRWVDLLCSYEATAHEFGEMMLHHAILAGMDQRAVELAGIASEQAEVRGDYDASARLLQAALPSAANIGPVAHAALFEAWVCRASVSEETSDKLIADLLQTNAMWQRLKQPVQLASSHMLLCRLHRYRGQRVIAREHLMQAIRLLESAPGGLDCLAQALGLGAQLELDERRHTAAASFARRAAKVARLAGNQGVRLDALTSLAIVRQRLRNSRDYTLLSNLQKIAERAALHEISARTSAALCDEALANMDLPVAQACVNGWGLSKRLAPNCWKSALAGREFMSLTLSSQFDQVRRDALGELGNTRTAHSMRFPAKLALALCLSRTEDQSACEALDEAEAAAFASGDPRNIALVRLAKIEHAFLAGRITDALAICTDQDALPPGADTPDTGATLSIWRARLEWIAGKRTDAASAPEPNIIAYPGSAADLAERGYAFDAAMAKLFVEGPEAPRLMGEAIAEFSAQGAKGGLNCALRLAKARGIAVEHTKKERGPYRAARKHRLGLTRREVEILRLMAEGASNREIAEHFGRSLRTVEHHVSAILGKMGLDNRIQAVLFAIAHPDVLEPIDH